MSTLTHVSDPTRGVMSAEEFRVLLDLWMACDPWPLAAEDLTAFKTLLERECQARGYPEIVEAYHTAPRMRFEP